MTDTRISVGVNADTLRKLNRGDKVEWSWAGNTEVALVIELVPERVTEPPSMDAA